MTAQPSYFRAAKRWKVWDPHPDAPSYFARCKAGVLRHALARVTCALYAVEDAGGEILGIRIQARQIRRGARHYDLSLEIGVGKRFTADQLDEITG